MNDYWYLCADTGIIKYAGKFDDFDGVEQYFEYNLVIGDLVTVEVAGNADAVVTGSPEGITVETKYYE